ncbi:MAG: zinc-dependent alcohol dehydrogenase [Bacteroidales bacterium]
MRQATMTAPGAIRIGEVEAPAAGAGQVLLRVQRIGVCGSDVHVYHGKHPFTPYPVVQGHEFSAVVEAVGAGVTGIKVGDRVTATPQETCGTCLPCLRGDYHICDSLRVRGFQAPGCAQDLFVTEAEKIVPLPDAFSFEQGAFVEPVAVGVHAVSRVGEVKGRNVAVLGAGPIGNLLAQVACAAGACTLITDISDFRLAVARQCGLDTVSNAADEPLDAAARRAFGSQGFDIVFECAGVEQTINAAIGSIRKGGTIVLVGVYGETPRLNIGLVQDRELSLIGTLMYKYEDFRQAVQLIADRQVVTEPLDSRHFPFADYPNAYQFIDQACDRSMKVFIDL